MKSSMKNPLNRIGSSLAAAAVVATGCALVTAPAYAQLNSGQPQILSTNQTITPLAPQGALYEQLNPGLRDNPEYTVGQAVSTVVSPDKKTLLILTSGYNLESYTSGANAGNTNPTDSTEWIFVFDISKGNPVQKQAISVPNTYSGIAFNPSGTEFYVSGGDNDNVHIYDRIESKWVETATPVALGHLVNPAPSGGIMLGGIGIETPPEAAGLAVTADGKTIVVANYENDSISVLGNSGSGWTKTGELDLRPGKINPADAGIPGGEFPYWVTIKGSDTAYVSSVRDREIDVVSLTGAPTLITRIPVSGSPNKSVIGRSQKRVFVAEDNSDTVAVIDTASNTLVGEFKVGIPGTPLSAKTYYRGANPNSLALSADEQTLFVTNAGENAVAVVRKPEAPGAASIAGLLPTGFYPNSVSLNGDETQLYIVNGKSATGPNPQYCTALTNLENVTCNASNQYDLQLTKAGFQTVPMPTDQELAGLTKQVLTNDNFLNQPTPEQAATMAALHKYIHHVIYIIKENRTYDQILGDLPVGNGDPSITQFGQEITPNFHAIASNFVDFDNFYDVSDVSGDGWPWSTSARTTDTIEKEIPPNYAGRGLDNNSEGLTRDLNVAIPTEAARVAAFPLLAAFGFDDPNILPGTANVAGPDSPEGEEGQGYIWDAALRANLSVRDYGFFIDIVPYNVPVSEGGTPLLTDPYSAGVKVARSSNPALTPYTDPYFRGFDNAFPDYYRFTEWNREFQGFVQSGNLPNLSLVRIMHDHTGNFSTAISGVNTVELQQADNDYGVGAVVDAVAHSPYKNNTLICVIEDDAQAGGDHVDAHRSTFYMVGPYVKHNYVDSTRYNTVSVLRTIEDILGIEHLNLNDANALPMADAFDLKQQEWTYNVTASPYLASTTLPIPSNQFASLQPMKSLHDAKWWADHTKGMDFSVEDHLDTPKYNRVMWEGTMGNVPYPVERSGKDLRQNRAALLKSYSASHQPSTAAESQPTAALNSGASE